jgi:putative ABC transport system permease protein
MVVQMRDDLKAAFRSLRSSKDVALAALIVLTLGIGATTAIFSVVDAVVLRALPFDEHDRLVAAGERRAAGSRSGSNTREPDALGFVAPQNYMDWAAQQRVFDSIAAIASGWLTLREPGGEPESLVPQRVTAQFFDVLRVPPAIGRVFAAENEVSGRDRVAVLSDAFWRRRFGGDPQIVGRSIPLDDLERGEGRYEVLGVMPPGFAYPVGVSRPTDIWIPYVVPADQRIRNPGSRSIYLQVIARLKPGVSLTAAQAQMDQIAAALETANPQWNKDSRIGVRPLIDHVVGSSTKSWMLMLLGSVGIVLLIACANVANLLLARATAREREIGIRAALGASRSRLVRQLMIESLVLSILGTLCAIVIGWWAVEVLRNAMPESLPRVTAIALNMRVLAAAAGLSLITAVLFGAVPALQSSRPDVSTTLKGGGRSSASVTRQRLRAGLVIAEVALAVVLLVGAAVFIGSFVSVMRIDLGFNPKNVLTAQISPPFQFRSVVVRPTNRAPAFAEIVERIRRNPGVLNTSMGAVPLSGNIISTSVTIPGKLDLTAGESIAATRVTPDYHNALKIPLRRGRLFQPTDRQGAPLVAIINDSAANKYFPGEDPIGRSIGLGGDARTIVGIVGDVHQSSFEMAPGTEAYIPMEQTSVVGSELVIRTSGNPYDALPQVKAAVFTVLPDVPLRNIRTMEELIAMRVAQRKVSMLLLGLFGLLGLVISAIGIYGVMAYLVSQREREIGVRMALGATRANVMRMVLLNAGMLVLSGLILGGVGAWYLSAAARTFLFSIEATDPRAFAAAFLLLALAAFVASAIPARRAASVDPMVALRAE